VGEREYHDGAVRFTFLAAFAMVGLLASAAAAAAPGADASSRPRVLEIHFTTDVDPVTEGWLTSQLDKARRDHYSAAVIVLDTPGGDEDSMRKIVQKELALSAAGTPVIVYVAPNGARAASAGVWISEAADLLAMAPETNIGSSTPIQSNDQNIGSDLRRKIINDAAASLRGLAASHDRNAAWASKAVKVASNLDARQALDMHVIDTIAPTLPALLNQVDGRVTVPAHLKLDTANAEITQTSEGFVTRFLSSVLLNPNIVSLLFLAGIVGIGFEIFHPGAIAPGALGAVALVLSLFGLYILPLSWTGLALVLLGAVLLVIDAHVVTHGALTLAGLVALGFGLASLFQSSSGPHTSVPLIIAVTVVLGGGWAYAMAKAVAARRMPPAVGPFEVIGMEGVVREDGLVYVNGELWHAHSADPLRLGQRVQVDALDGLTLQVHQV
jgi:membrane-bound serine protease (ClpP class)